MLLGIRRSASIPNNIHITLVLLVHALLTVICAKNRKTIIVDASPPDVPSSATVADASPSPLPIPHESPLIPTKSQSLSVLPVTPPVDPSLSSVLAASEPLSPVFSPVPLTIPEVRHLLGCLIWPPSTNTRLMLAWSTWRRCHQGLASAFHTKRRLDAG